MRPGWPGFESLWQENFNAEPFTRPLGISIAPLVLGGNVFGWTADEAASFAILDRFLDQGFNALIRRTFTPLL